MSDYKVCILLLLEIGSFMLIWSLFNKLEKKRLLKSVLIVLCTSLVALVTNYIYPPVQFIVNYLFLFTAIKLVFHKNIKYLLLEFGLVLFVFALVQLIVIVILRFIIPGFLDSDEFVFLLIANILCMLFCLCIYKYTPYNKLIVFFKRENPRIFLLSINMLIYILITKWIWNFKRENFMEGIALYLVIPAAFILVNVVYLDIHMKRIDLKKSLEDYQKYSPVISGLLEDVRRRQHDFRNHLNTIYSLALISDGKHLKESITQYMDSLSHSLEDMEKVLCIDNTVVTAILYNKINEAEKHRIEFQYAVDKDSRLPYKDHELSEILNNLLDNAFEAVMDSRIENKRVFLHMGCLEDGCVIEVGNSGQRIGLNDISRIFEAGFTTKKGENHGYGLFNVKKIVESYGGRIQLSYDNNFTIFSVRL